MSMSVIIEMRKEYYSVPENKVARDTIGHSMAELCPGIVQGFQRGYFYVFASYQEVWYWQALAGMLAVLTNDPDSGLTVN